MPRYFFDVYDGVAMPDLEGRECADWQEARRLATCRAGELLQNAPERLWGEEDLTVHVRDEQGLQLFTVVVLGLISPAAQGFVR